MKLKFQNIGKISEAEIEVSSITVIAGNNDTGKSTVGKLLYAVTTALNLLTPEFLLRKKFEAIYNELRSLDRWTKQSIDLVPYRQFGQEHGLILMKRYIDDFAYDDNELVEIEGKLNKLVLEMVKDLRTQLKREEEDKVSVDRFEQVYNDIIQRVELSAYDEKIQHLAIQDLLLTEFSDSLTSELCKDQLAKILMKEANGDLINLQFLNNELQTTSKIDVTRDFSRSFYIDNPFILDRSYNEYPVRLSPSRHSDDVYGRYKHREQLTNLIHSQSYNQNYFDKILQNEKITQIFSSVIDGNIKMGRRSYQYYANKFAEPLKMESISTGMKSFAVIKLLMEKGYLSNSEFLILDEPEIHLHPEWQLKYAELVVLLTKYYPIRLLLTSHSPYFVEAIELYSKFHKIEQVRYYKTEHDGEMSKIINVTDCIEKLYEDMAVPFRKLEELQEEIDGE